MPLRGPQFAQNFPVGLCFVPHSSQSLAWLRPTLTSFAAVLYQGTGPSPTCRACVSLALVSLSYLQVTI